MNLSSKATGDLAVSQDFCSEHCLCSLLGLEAWYISILELDLQDGPALAETLVTKDLELMVQTTKGANYLNSSNIF